MRPCRLSRRITRHNPPYGRSALLLARRAFQRANMARPKQSIPPSTVPRYHRVGCLLISELVPKARDFAAISREKHRFLDTLSESPTRRKRPEVRVASLTAVRNPAAYSATLRARLRISEIPPLTPLRSVRGSVSLKPRRLLRYAPCAAQRDSQGVSGPRQGLRRLLLRSE